MIAFVARLLMVAALVAGAAVLTAVPAQAHPLGNATVNHYDGLRVFPDKIVDNAVIDTAEIPTFQRKRLIDTDRDGRLSEDERAAYGSKRCEAMARSTRLDIGNGRLPLDVVRSSYVERPGQIGLTSGRLECDLEAVIDLEEPTELRVDSAFDSQGIGWHEITAVGIGVGLRDSPFPERSISKALSAYPEDLLSAPLDVRSGTVLLEPGGSSSYRAAQKLPVAGPAVRALDGLAQRFNEAVGAERLTLGVGVLAVLLSMLLGAGHAFLPGHGKTVMAAYLVGRRGHLRDVITVGATVTATHTAGVLVLGLLLAGGSAFAPTAAEQLLGIVSGVIIALVGLGLLVSALRRRHHPRLRQSVTPRPAVPELALAGIPGRESPAHEHFDDHSHDHVGDHSHHHPGDLSHDHPHPEPSVQVSQAPAVAHRHGLLGRGHAHTHAPAAEGSFSRSGLIGLGVAGGLVPSPSALLVLVAATALGRTGFGVVLVLGYGVGMALALCAAGLLLVRLRGRLDRFAGSPRLARADRVLAALPALTAVLVIVVGVGLALRAAGGAV